MIEELIGEAIGSGFVLLFNPITWVVAATLAYKQNGIGSVGLWTTGASVGCVAVLMMVLANSSGITGRPLSIILGAALSGLVIALFCKAVTTIFHKKPTQNEKLP